MNEKELKHRGCQCAWVTITKKMHGSWKVFWLIRKDGCYASELVDEEPSMSKDVTVEDLRPLNSSQARTTVLKPRGVKGSGSACWAYFTEPVVNETGKVMKRMTHCCVTSENGKQCRAE